MPATAPAGAPGERDSSEHETDLVRNEAEFQALAVSETFNDPVPEERGSHHRSPATRGIYRALVRSLIRALSWNELAASAACQCLIDRHDQDVVRARDEHRGIIRGARHGDRRVDVVGRACAVR